MKKFVTTLFLAVLTGNVWATAQMGDILVYQGENQPIFSNPLESDNNFIDKYLHVDKKYLHFNIVPSGESTLYPLVGAQGYFLTSLFFLF